MSGNKRSFQLTMLSLLCSGLLLVGVGIGVQLAELSTFTYGGERLLDQAVSQTRRLTVELEPESRVSVSSSDGDLFSQLRETGRVEASETVAPDTLELELTYESAGPEIGFWDDCWETEDGDREEIGLYWSGWNDLAFALTCKDQLLADLQSRRISRYLPGRLTEAVIRVNPADVERVQLG